MRRITLGVGFPVGVAATVFGIGIAHSRLTSPRYIFGSQNSMFIYVLLVGLHLLAAHSAGLPSEVRDAQPAIVAAALSSLVATATFLVLQTIWPGLLPRGVILASGVLVPLTTFSFAWLTVALRRRERRRERILAVIGQRDYETLQRDIESRFPQKEREFELELAAVVAGEQPLKELLHDVRRAADDNPSSKLILSDEATRTDDVYALAESLHRRGMKVLTLSDFYQMHFGKLPPSELNRMALLFDIRDRHNPTFRHVKRMVDLVGGLVAAVLCTVLTPIVLLANVFANRGPLLYRQQRVGRDGTEFAILKFRTMRPHAHDALTPWTRIDDPRITPFGRWLRRTHLDELPQAVNILRGELSLVGPRPEQPHLAAELIMKEPAFELRQLVTPGLTGWAQVKFRYAATEAAALEKLQYDLYYVANQSLTLDFRILSRTIRSVIGRRGR